MDHLKELTKDLLVQPNQYAEHSIPLPLLAPCSYPIFSCASGMKLLPSDRFFIQPYFSFG